MGIARNKLFIKNKVKIITIAAITGLYTNDTRNLKLNSYLIINTEYIMKKIISVNNVATAAPIMPYMGISIKFSIMFITAALA